MERSRWQSAYRGGKAPRKKRRSSPLPGAVGSRAGVSQLCRRRLFGNAGPRGPQPGGLERKSNVKALPKIKENLEVTKGCNQSSQVNVKETTDLEKKEEKTEENSAVLKETLLNSSENNESLETADMTSSAGMTLPTGVSTFLLECLDEGSTEDHNACASDSLNSFPSPETFRDGSERSNLHAEDSGKYKNSTLLDSSKAVAIDKMPQISNLSSILEPVLEDFKDEYTRRKRPSSCISSALSVSTTVAGKKVCKITSARENTPALKTGMRCSSPLGPERKPDNQNAKPRRLKGKKKQRNPDTVEEGASSFRQQMSSSVLIMEEYKALQRLGYAQPAELDLSLSPVCKASPAEDLLLNTTRPYVNSEEIVLASLSSEKEMIPQSPEEKNIFKPLCGKQEICSIVRTSPCQNPAGPRRIPANTKAFSFPKGVPEDTITSTKNWIYCKHR
ncbi:meiosis-specific kinetochore protein [Leptosomus discolor]